MRRKWLKIACWVLLTPLILFVILMVLLYVPPVQNLLRREATAIASEATGMDISVERIDLRFPLNLLVRGVQVVQPAEGTDRLQPDTLLSLQSLNVHIQALPLFKGQVEVDNITLKQVAVNSSDLIDGMQLNGVLGNLSLESHGVDLVREDVVLNRIELDDTHVRVLLTDTTETSKDTTSTALDWLITLHALTLKDVSVELQMPLDSTYLTARLSEAQINDATADLKNGCYGWRQFSLSGTSVKYDVGTSAPAEGFDASHIALRDIRTNIDSVSYCGRDIHAVIREFSLNERSGLSISSLTGRLQTDSVELAVPSLKLLTPHSEVMLSAHTYWELINIPTTGELTARLDARIGKQDVLLFAGGLPKAFKEAYPAHPLVIHAGTEGNLKQMQLSRFSAELPGAFSLKGGGEFRNLADTLTRNGRMDFNMETLNLNFLTGLTGTAPNGSMVVPDSMQLSARLEMEGPQCTASLTVHEGEGKLKLDASYNLSTEAYHALLDIDALQVHHFLPQDSIYGVTARFSARGQGTDIASRKTVAAVDAALGQLQYGHWTISDIRLQAGLKSSVASARLLSSCPLLKMHADADMRLDRQYLDGKLTLDVAEVDLHKLGMAPKPLKRPFAFTLGAEARHDSVKMALDAGDMNFRFKTRSTLKQLMGQAERFSTLLMRQIDERHLDHAALRRLLPSAGMSLQAGVDNPISYFLATKGVSYHDFKLNFGFTPEIGINGRSAIHGLRMDSLQLDTIYFSVRQDTTRMRLQGGVINGPKNPQFVFRSSLTGEIRNEDAELTVHYVDDKGDTGVLFGINARPLTEGNGRGNGVLLNLVPAEPIIAFRKFHFEDNSNWIYLHKNMRVYANVDMDGDDGLCFRMQSDRNDTLSLQNINLELSRFRLDELSNVLPYMPRLTGLFSAEANYVQTDTSLQVSAEADIQQLTYENRPVGDVGIGVTWLPAENGTHYLNSYFMYDNQEVLLADGTLTQQEGASLMDATVTLEHFPLKIANAFVPDRVIELSGDMDGEVAMRGTLDKPDIRGSLVLDSASVYIPQAGARYRLDNRPVRLADNRLLFDKFAIYTTSENPFTIDGNVNFSNMDRPTANLVLQAENYTLLDAPRTRESLVYGKVFVDLNAAVKGPLDGLSMRGSMNLLGNTNVTYVLTDSPLTVEDRLDGLVTFTSFNDTTSVSEKEVSAISLGGLEMNMSVHIDDAVRLRADLSTDRSKYIELEGGGDLNMVYTSQGDMSLTGRYTLSGGIMKYSLPIIPLKEFQFTQGSYVDWRGNIMNPTLNLKATERVRASVADSDGNGSRMVNFDVSISIKNSLDAPELIFDLAAPEDAAVENELQAMGAEERSKQAITMLATGIYLNNSGKGGGLTMGAALNSVLQSQINSLAGNLKGSLNVGIEDRTSSETGDTQKDFSFRYSQRFFNDRIQIVIGGKVSAGANATNDVESFIDNISLEYRLDVSGTRYVRVFYDKNYESILDGEITETGVGLVMRKKMDRLSELFIFRKKKKNLTEPENKENINDEIAL